MENKACDGLLLTSKFYKKTKNTSILDNKKRNTEGKASIQPEGTVTKKQENTTTKTIVTRKVCTNKLHTKIGHTGEDRMCATAEHIHYRIKGTLDIYEDCATEKVKHKLEHKVAEERDLKPDKMIYIDMISQKKPSYGGSKNCILIQDSDTRQKWYFFTNTREDLS